MEDERILILDLLEILQNYTDENHSLTQQNIIDILEKDYGYNGVRRQTIKNNLEKLKNINMENFEIICQEKVKSVSKDSETGEEKKTFYYTDFKYLHKFTEGELRLIIDSILFSKHIDLVHRKGLIEKLEGLASLHFKSGMNHIRSLDPSNRGNRDLFWNIEEINRAISKSKKIVFNYGRYDYDGKKISLLARKNSEGQVRDYIINPYYMLASQGRYYLICNNDSYDEISSYRIDRIQNIRVLENENRKPPRLVKGMGENFSLTQYAKEHIYVFTGESEYIKLAFKEEFLDEFIDSFGLEDINFQEKNQGEIVVRFKANKMAMRRWALRYSLYVRVLSPKDLVDDIKSDLKKAIENYK